MWTDLNKGDWFTCQSAKKNMNDYECIRYNEGGKSLKFLPNDSRKLHKEFVNFLESELLNDFGGKTIVVTHHAPSVLSVSDKYLGFALNDAYFEDMSRYMFDNAIVSWFHGHMHNSSDYTIGETRIIANPRGYVGHLNSDFDINFLIEL